MQNESRKKTTAGPPDQRAKSLCWLALAFATVTSQAQNYAIDWFTLGGGGGESIGGAYAISGTTGQPDAGTMSGGSYSVTGGFWSVVAAEAPRLNITRDALNGAVTVSWPLPATGWVLEQTPTLPGSPSTPWPQVAFPYQTNATHIFITLPAPSGNQFYRLHKP